MPSQRLERVLTAAGMNQLLRRNRARVRRLYSLSAINARDHQIDADCPGRYLKGCEDNGEDVSDLCAMNDAAWRIPVANRKEERHRRRGYGEEPENDNEEED